MQKLCVFFYDTGKLVEYALTDLSGPYMDLQHLQLSGLLAGNRKMETSVGDIEHILLTHPEAGTLSSHICSFLDKNKVTVHFLIKRKACVRSIRMVYLKFVLIEEFNRSVHPRTRKNTYIFINYRINGKIRDWHSFCSRHSPRKFQRSTLFF